MKNLMVLDSRNIETNQQRMFNLMSCAIIMKISHEEMDINLHPEKLAFLGVEMDKRLSNNMFIMSLFSTDFEFMGNAHITRQIGKSDFFIESIFIRNDMRGRGLGTTLLRYIINKCPNIGAITFKENLSFFKKQGFCVAEQWSGDFLMKDARDAHPEGIFFIKKGVVSKKSIDRKHKMYICQSDFVKNMYDKS